jgi:hypothetical protein
MKQFFVLAALSFFLFTSCKKVTEVTEVTQTENPAKGIHFLIKPTDWETTDGGVSFHTSMPIPELTQDIYDHGAVLTYIAFGTDFYEALPEVFDGIAYGAIHEKGFVTVDYHALDGSVLSAPSANTDIKVILINAAVAKLHPDVNFRNLKEVQNVFLKNQPGF